MSKITLQLHITTVMFVVALLSLSLPTPTAAFSTTSSARSHGNTAALSRGVTSIETSSDVNARTRLHLLQYRRFTVDDEFDQPILMQLANGKVAATDYTVVSSTPKAFLLMMGPKDDEQRAMDQYLHYIDRRYAHMNSAPSTNKHGQASTKQSHHRHVSLVANDEDASSRQTIKKQDKSTTKTLVLKLVSSFVRPLTYLCGALAVVLALIRSNGYYS